MYASVNKYIQNYGLDTLKESDKGGKNNHISALVKK